LSGANLIHDVGYLESGLTGDLDFVTALDEFIGLTKKILGGYEVSEETLAVDLIDEKGPGGDFLTERHTVDHFRDETWIPELLDRKDYQGWKKEGSTSLKDRAHSKAEKILNSHQPERIAETKQDRIKEIIDRVEGEVKGNG
jgi:trimethylamine--corrinoid protein Co-methyltransferase